MGSRIRIRACPTLAGSIVNQYFGVILDDDNTLSGANSSAIIENAKGPFRLINNNTYTNTKSVNISHRFSARKFFGKRNVVDDDFLSAQFGNNPANQAYYLVWTETPLSAQINTITFDVTIDYIVRCHEPKDISQS